MFNQNVTCEEFCRAEKKDQKRSPIIREGWTLYTRSVQFLCQSIVEICGGYLVKVFKSNLDEMIHTDPKSGSDHLRYRRRPVFTFLRF